MKATLLIALSAMAMANYAPAELPNWTFKSSGVSFQAEFISYDETSGKATFKNKDGKRADIDINLLVDLDRIKISGEKNFNNPSGFSWPSPIAEIRQLHLIQGWSAGLRKAQGASEELFVILAGSMGVSPDIDISSAEQNFVYPGIRYLDNLKNAVTAFFPENSPLPAQKLISSPGFPAGSCYAYSYKGDIVDKYAEDKATFSHITVVVDSKDQVVCIQFLHNTPKSRLLGLDYNYYAPENTVYNFVDYRRKAVSTYKVFRKNVWRLPKSDILDSSPRFSRSISEPSAQQLIDRVKTDPIIRLDAELLDSKNESREWTRLYLPMKFARIMVHVLSQ